MKITEHSNNLIQLTFLKFVNCYLVREDDGFTLIDTGISGANAKQIMQAAQQFNLPILRIVLTHAHGDHVGSLDALHELLPEAEVGHGRVLEQPLAAMDHAIAVMARNLGQQEQKRAASVK
ncbi:MAG TPA: MBL fold metallo-hydrolase [Ktedonobacteraceae bacterium]|nr:MBL fold metallo-hydrolase [Ktedonobacteraceae bacterium]